MLRGSVVFLGGTKPKYARVSCLIITGQKTIAVNKREFRETLVLNQYSKV